MKLGFNLGLTSQRGTGEPGFRTNTLLAAGNAKTTALINATANVALDLSADTLVTDYNLGLVTPVQSFTAPHGSSFCIATVSGRYGSVGANYSRYTILVNDIAAAKIETHQGFYNTGHVSRVIPITGGDIVTFKFVADATTLLDTLIIGAAFYG